MPTYSGLTNPSEAAAFHPTQAGYDPLQQQAILAGLQGCVVVSGCAVSAQGTPNMTVAVGSGVVGSPSGAAVAVSSGNVTISAADPSNPRIDLVVAAFSNGTKSVLTGAPAPPADSTHSGPIWPAAFDATTYAVLAEVYIPAGQTSITAPLVTDKRVIGTPPGTFAVPRRDFTTGDYYTNDWSGVDNTMSNAAGVLVLSSFTVDVAHAFDLISIEVTVTAPGSVILPALYPYIGGRPGGAPVFDFGTLDSATATGLITKAIALSLPRGRYGLGWTAQGGAPTLRGRSANTLAGSEGTTNPGNYNANSWQLGGVTGALPNPLVGLATNQSGVLPKIMLRAA